jgi:ABC-type uncharacterized transport system ATPase subunit
MTSVSAVILAVVCSEMMQSKLENTAGFEVMDTNSDMLGLLNLKKERKNPALAMVEARVQAIRLKQFNMMVQKYHDVFIEQNMEVLGLCGG